VSLSQNLRASRREGACTAVTTGATEPFVIPYALALGASPTVAGLLSSGRNLLVAILQLWTSDAVARLGSRRRLALWTAGAQAVLLMPVALAQPAFGAWAVPALIAFFTLGAAIAALGTGAWGSLIADFVDPAERGRWFGQRARIIGLWTTGATLVAGPLLQVTAHRPALGFGVLMGVAAVSRLVAWVQIRQVTEAEWHDAPELRFSFAEFLRATPRSNFARFSLALGGLNFATHMAAPYFAVYLLEERGLSYLSYSLVILAGALTSSLASAAWGRVGDRAGNHAVLRWATLGVSFMPIIWTFAPNALALGVVNASGALLWSGINLAATNFLYDAVTPEKRHTCLAYFNVVNGSAIGLGALAGGAVLALLPGPPADGFWVLFVASSALRVVVALAFRRAVREVRVVAPLELGQLFLDLVGQRLVALLEFLPSRRTPPRAGDESRRGGQRRDP
jgi:MFS family permease